MGKIICSKTGNSGWFSKEMHHPEVESGAFRLVDNTNIPTRKNAFIYIRNTSQNPATRLGKGFFKGIWNEIKPQKDKK